MAKGKFLKPAAALVAMTAAASALIAARADAAPASDRAAIEATMMKYQDALNASSTEQALALYTDDGVFMPPYSQSAVGKDAVRQAYEKVFRTITLSVKFHIAEITQVAPAWAVVRTSSAGTQTVHATGAKTAEANQELFVLHKGPDGRWRIARYAFSTTNPPPGG
jgi:uncharacterized protein (TIGR02246 family)